MENLQNGISITKQKNWNLHSKGHHSRYLIWLFKPVYFLLVLSVFLLSGCGSSSSELGTDSNDVQATTTTPVRITNIDEITGTWKSEPLGMAIEIMPDGAVPFAVTAGKIERGAYEYLFSFDSGQLKISGSPGCEEKIGTYEVQLLPNGNLVFSVIEDNCLLRANGLIGQKIEPVMDIEWIKAN